MHDEARYGYTVQSIIFFFFFFNISGALSFPTYGKD